MKQAVCKRNEKGGEVKKKKEMKKVEEGNEAISSSGTW